MNSRSNDSLSIESLGAYSQPVNSSGLGSSLGHSATATHGARKVVQVPRRLNDQVQFSQECTADNGSASDLCSNFMAAWG